MPALLPDEREVARRRQSLIVLAEPPGKILGVALVVLLVAALFDPLPLAIVLAVIVAAVLVWRWLNWRAGWVLLTDKRIIRVQGLPETTEIEAFLRVDRISGVVLIQSIAGKLLRYGTIHLEAPGDHPALRKLEKVADVGPFYRRLRDVVFGTRSRDPDQGIDAEHAEEYVTEPLPALSRRREPGPPRDRFGRRQGW